MSDSEEHDSVSKPLFRRRKLASNWDRYAPLPPEDEDDVKPQQIGVDFVSLLSQTGIIDNNYNRSNFGIWPAILNGGRTFSLKV